MKERIKTLLIDSNGAVRWEYALVDTVLRGLLGLEVDVDTLPVLLRQLTLVRKVLGQRYETLSYAIDWREALCAAPELDVEVFNINNLVDYWQRREAIRSYPLIIILHSAAGDRMSLLLKTAYWFQQRRGKLVVFLGNEYDLMDQKFAFLRSTGADFVCSQLPLETARWLYAECQPTRVLAMPHALNPKLYYPASSQGDRSIDIGFIGDTYPYFVGDIERDRLLRFFQGHCADLGLMCEIRIHPRSRVPRTEWARFLNVCKGIIGAESGSYYLDRKGRIIGQAKAYLRKHPRSTFEEIFERYFQSPRVEYLSGKAISSRHFEPIGTKTCQILLDGDYNGILNSDEHYISVRKDLSNIHEAVKRFKDEDYRKAMVERTYEYVMSQHTYRHRVEALITAVM
jgi:hypothetical protein